MARLLKDPVTLFLVAGLGLFLVYELLGGEETTDITLGAATLAVLVQEYESLTGKKADASLRQQLVDDYYRREVLFREGLREGLHLSDAELREAIIGRMQQRVSGALPDPTEEELVNYYAGHMDRYYAEATISFEQVFFQQKPVEGDAVRARLETGETGIGDAPPGGAIYPDYGESMLRGLFGDTTVTLLRTAQPGRWVGPLESVRGWHFFRVTDRQAPRPMAFAQVYEQVRLDLQTQALNRRVAEFVESRRSRYPMVLEAQEAAP